MPIMKTPPGGQTDKAGVAGPPNSEIKTPALPAGYGGPKQPK